ncbi:hypothetical protein EMPG_13080 [Blastomyces silverae]|uniref:Uncharacterized protein n=1 Tax=Blastomyces silverae TaxID=2060906 RepID=A0A0H1BKV3_9EURO|nr:hypothetical protein EMPG_13080 [Blastomyces silverae]
MDRAYRWRYASVEWQLAPSLVRSRFVHTYSVRTVLLPWFCPQPQRATAAVGI